MTINTDKIITYEFSFTDQDIDALKKVRELFKFIDSELTEEGNPHFIVDSENKTGIEVSIFSKAYKTITNLLNFEKWEA